MSLTYIDHGFYKVSAKYAGQLAKPVGGLPRLGWEKRVTLPNGVKCWLSRTPVGGKQVWAVRACDTFVDAATGRNLWNWS